MCTQKYPLLKITNQKRLFTLDQEKKKPFFLSKIHKDQKILILLLQFTKNIKKKISGPSVRKSF